MFRNTVLQEIYIWLCNWRLRNKLTLVNAEQNANATECANQDVRIHLTNTDASKNLNCFCNRILYQQCLNNIIITSTSAKMLRTTVADWVRIYASKALLVTLFKLQIIIEIDTNTTSDASVPYDVLKCINYSLYDIKMHSTALNHGSRNETREDYIIQ